LQHIDFGNVQSLIYLYFVMGQSKMRIRKGKQSAQVMCYIEPCYFTQDNLENKSRSPKSSNFLGLKEKIFKLTHNSIMLNIENNDPFLQFSFHWVLYNFHKPTKSYYRFTSWFTHDKKKNKINLNHQIQQFHWT
jgi:hypothetical protein